MAWFVNPTIDAIYGEAEATGLLDKMLENTPIGVGDHPGNYIADGRAYNVYLTALYYSISKLKHRWGNGEPSNLRLLKNTVFFGYLLSYGYNLKLDGELSNDLDDIVERIAGPGEKYNDKVYMSEAMFRVILKHIYLNKLTSAEWEMIKEKSPYHRFTYPPDFFINLDFVKNLDYPHIMGIKIAKSAIQFMNWHTTNPFN